jgi:hypothetical protein
MRLSDQFKHIRHSSLQISLKALNYRLLKSDFKLEDYLDVVNEKKKYLLFVDLEHLIIDYQSRNGRWTAHSVQYLQLKEQNVIPFCFQ